MNPAEPDPAPPPAPAQSLSHRLSAALGAMPLPRGWHAAAAFGALLAAGPLLTLAGATLLAQHERNATVRLQAQLALRLGAEATARAARTALANAAGRAAPGQVLEVLAGALPADAGLMRVERTRDGGLELDVAGSDPDTLRAAIRRAPELAGMRNTSQRRTDAAMIVSMREDAQ
ncbi:hypothetical protein FHR20_003486 [Sphingomonas leidyi]|uniref:Uncharacterized protein n=1 Tax=Sphingomonas leidyi TaxID=68569 RepID=A0A7X5V247_9SPHN|nr:hypothetical protein [Sphingomonas leidyi]NIJ66513.1 hypothetical protein [Sphingomonas leidyi]